MTCEVNIIVSCTCIGAVPGAKSEPAGRPACNRVCSLILGEMDGDGKD